MHRRKFPMRINILFSTFKKNLFRKFFLEINVHFPFLMQKGMVQTQIKVVSPALLGIIYRFSQG